MNLNVQARNQLDEFCKLEKKATDIGMLSIAIKASSLLKHYLKDPELSILDQYNYLDTLYAPLKQFINKINSQKPWWKKILNFFGFRSSAEKQLLEVTAAVKKARNRLDNSKLYSGPLPSILCPGIDPTAGTVDVEYNSYTPEEKIKYLSHHLMGSKPLNHHKELNGQSFSEGHYHFYNDLKNFIKQEKKTLDEPTLEQLKKIRKQLKHSLILAKIVDEIGICTNGSKQQKLIADLSHRVQKSIAQLPEGGSLIFPHGYLKQKGGHATLLECTKINAQEIVLRIINTGSGQIETHDFQVFPASEGRFWAPVRITSPLNLSKLAKNKFFDELFTSLGNISGQPSKDKMNEPFIRLHAQGKLHNDKRHIILQTNGTCTHSSLMEWLKLKISPATYRLYHFVTVTRAFNHLQHFNEKNKVVSFQTAVADLRQAGVNTKDTAAIKLAQAIKDITQERDELQNQLAKLLSKKGKQLAHIKDFNLYFKKKLAKENKLTSAEHKQINSEHSTTPWKKSLGFFKSKNLSDRAEKAILAKKIQGHNAFLIITKAE